MPRTVPAAVVALTAVVIGAVTAYAAVVGPDNTIHGCYSREGHKGAHILAVLDSGANCPSNTIAVNWNQQGPTGPAGPAGPAGPQGPAGQLGPPAAINAAAYSDNGSRPVAPGDTAELGPVLLRITDPVPAPPGQTYCHIVQLLGSVELGVSLNQINRFVAQFAMDGQSTGIGPVFGGARDTTTLTRAWSLTLCPGQHSFRVVVHNVGDSLNSVSFVTLTAIDFGRGPACPGSQGCP